MSTYKVYVREEDAPLSSIFALWSDHPAAQRPLWSCGPPPRRTGQSCFTRQMGNIKSQSPNFCRVYCTKILNITEHNTCLILQNPVICWTRQPSTDPPVPGGAPLHSKSLHVTWERLAHSGLIWSNIMSQAVSWLLQMSGWHQSQYPHRFACNRTKNCARTPRICIYINRRLYNQLFSLWAILPYTQYHTHTYPSN